MCIIAVFSLCVLIARVFYAMHFVSFLLSATPDGAVCSEMNLRYYAAHTHKATFYATAGDENDSVLAVPCDAEL